MAPVGPRHPDSKRPPDFGSLAGVFARDANLTFGGGNATTETLRREIVERRDWLSNQQFEMAYAASRLSPATSLLALCTAMGWQIRGLPGAMVALLAASMPAGVLATIAMAGYQEIERNDVAAGALRGAVAASVALLLSSAWALVRPRATPGTRLRTSLIIAASWAAHVLGASPLVVLATAASVGALWREAPAP